MTTIGCWIPHEPKTIIIMKSYHCIFKPFVILLSLTLAAALLHAEERVTTDAKGRIQITPLVHPDPIANPWPAAWEDAFQTRRDAMIKKFKGRAGVNVALENEKGTYPSTILAFCAGDREQAIEQLQQLDSHPHTMDVDFYWCFTLKGQMRKYFFLGKYLTPEYHARMKKGATAWVATDPRPNTELVLLTDSRDPAVAAYALEAMKKMWRNPDQLRQMADEAATENHPNKLKFAEFIRGFADRIESTPPTDSAGWKTWWKKLCEGDWIVFEEYDRRTNLRPHPQAGIGKGPVGTDWSPETRGGVVDWRNTDNLRAMRETSVYLMAEETGSELVRKIFKERLRFTARTFWSIGNGEWDSPTYHGHTIAAYLNLYDFAQDKEVRLSAKAILDFLTTSAALKYNHGAFGGPNRRDYGIVVAECGPSDLMHLWVAPVGATPRQDIEYAFSATSSYRPPAAVVALARKEITKPVEILATHPSYQTWIPGNDEQPASHETQYIAHTYQIGSMIEGADYDGSGLKIMVQNAQGEMDFVVPSSQNKGNICNNRAHNDRIAQYRNLILLVNSPKTELTTDWNMLVPKTATAETVNDVTFLKCHQTWAAIHGANSTFAGIDPKKAGAFGKGDMPGAILTGKGTAPGLSGFAMEWGEPQTHGDYDAFKKSVLARSKLDTSALGEGKLVYTSATGESVGIQWTGKDAPKIWRNGQPHDLANHMALWQPADGTKSPLSLGWNKGVLHVEAGGHTFTGNLDLKTGTYTFEQTLAK